jgi:hypothetical protein
MPLKVKIVEALNAMAAGSNLSQKRKDAIVAKVYAKAKDEAEITEHLTTINEFTPFSEIARLDDHERGKAEKTAADAEAKRLADIEAAKPPVDPKETPMEKMMREVLEGQKAFATELATLRGEKVATTRKQTAAEKLKDAPEAFRKSVLADMEDINFRDDDHYNSFLERKAGEAALVIQDNSNAGLGGDAPARGLAGKPAAEKEVSAEMKQYQADRLAERAKTTV